MRDYYFGQFGRFLCIAIATLNTSSFENCMVEVMLRLLNNKAIPGIICISNNSLFVIEKDKLLTM